MSTKPTVHRTRASLNVSKRNVPAVLMVAKSTCNAFEADPKQFPAPNPSVAVLLGQIQALETAQQATSTRAKGTAAARDAKRDVLWTSLESERAYVQSLCDASPEQAAAIITAAAMTVAKTAKHDKPVLRATPGAQPGTASVVANASALVGRRNSKKVVFNWQISADGGKTWSNGPSTPLARADFAGLASMTSTSFRVSVTVSKTVGEWSQSVTILVR